jgi:hypothetical protein
MRELTDKRHFTVVLALLGCGCAASLPPSVKNRQAFTQFNPSGTWVVPGQALRFKDQTVPVTVSLEPGHQTFDLALTTDDPRSVFFKGHAFVDGDWVYTMTSDNLGHTTLRVYDVGADQMDGVTVYKNLGYQHAVRKDKAPGDPVAGNWKLKGINADGSNYDADLIITKLGDHYSLTSIDAGGSKHEGVAFLSGTKLVGCTVTSLSVRTSRKLVATGDGLYLNERTRTSENEAHFVLGAYHNEAGVLRGSSLYGSNEADDMNREQEKLLVAEWTRRGAAAPTAAAPAPPAAPATAAAP